MSLRGFELTKGTTGPNASTTDDNISALLLNGPAVAAAGEITGIVHGQAYEITKPEDAEVMGIDAAYDTDNDVRVYRHIKEFYRMAGKGTKLWIMIVPEATTMKTAIETYGESLIVAADGAIRGIAVGYNPEAGYTPVALDGMETVVREAIAPAQLLHEWSWNTDRPVYILLEGRGVSATVAGAADLRALTEGAASLEATHVGLVIGQDWDYADALVGEAQKYADIGTALGSKAFLPVNRSIAEVETMNISSALLSKWLTAGLSNHLTIKELDADLADWDSKGYIFGLKYTGEPGIRWNNDHVCSPEGVDDEGYIKISTLAHAATINKAARELRKRLLPRVKSTVPVDVETGLLPIAIVKEFEGIGNKAIGNQGQMVKDGEISGGKTIVDPASNLQTGEKALDTDFWVVPTSTIGKIKGTINLKTSLS
jgi:hypothetical protein